MKAPRIEQPDENPTSRMRFNLWFDTHRVSVPHLLEALESKSWPDAPPFKVRYRFRPEELGKVRGRIVELIHAQGGEVTLRLANNRGSLLYRSDGQTLTCHLPGAQP